MPATDGSEAGVAARDAVLSTSDSVSQAQKEEKGVTITPVRVRLRAKPATIAQCPPEVLHKIIQLTLVVDVFDHEAELLRTNIRLVSSQWNQVMLSDPAFWTSIFVTFLKAGKPFMLHPFKRNYRNPSYEEGGIRTTAEEAVKCIARRIVHSRDRPKDLRISRVAGSGTVLDAHKSGLVRLILETGNWRSISIITHPHLDDDFDLTRQIFSLRNQLPAPTWASLQTFHLRAFMLQWRLESAEEYDDLPDFLEESGEDYGVGMPMTAEAFPALRHVTLDMAGRLLRRWDLPWAQLTSLTLHYFRSAFFEYLDILEKCSVLEQLSIQVGPDTKAFHLQRARMTTALKEQIVTLPCLHTLVLMVDMRCNILTAFVPKLILPSLRALEYHDTFNMDWGASQYSTKIFHALSVLVKNSQGAALEFLTLRLRKMGFDESAFREFRSELPALTSLDVEDQYSTPEPEIVADDYFERSPAH